MSAASPLDARATSIWYTVRDDHTPRHPGAYPAPAIRLESRLVVEDFEMEPGDYILGTPRGLKLARRDVFGRVFRECTEQESAAAFALAAVERDAEFSEVWK